MRKSRSETAQTRERIVSTASKMFLEEGLGAVGMREIMGAANLTQGGFYRHFESKEQLIAEANSTAFDRLIAMLEGETARKSSIKAVESIVSLYLGQSQAKEKPYLCPLAMLGAELSHCDPQVRAIAIHGCQRLVQLIADRLTHQTKATALATASGIVSTMVGAVTLADITPDRATATAVLSNAQALIKAHLPSDGSRSGIKSNISSRRSNSHTKRG